MLRQDTCRHCGGEFHDDDPVWCSRDGSTYFCDVCYHILLERKQAFRRCVAAVSLMFALFLLFLLVRLLVLWFAATPPQAP